jgi:ubiquinone/menaquinone biosynthesis C-methylase UbiE
MASSKSDSESREHVHVDTYILEGAALERLMQERSATRQGEFFLKYLKPGMCLLDAGCGGGSITLGLAEIVTPGEVTGLDMNSKQIQIATKLACDRGLRNIRFRQGDVYELPFQDSSLDAVFSNSLLEHLSEPEQALREFHRVLKSQGVVGVRTVDWRGNLQEPANPALIETWKLVGQLRKHQGGNMHIGPEIIRLLRKSGFVEVEVGASYDCYPSMEDRNRFAQMVAGMCRESAFATGLIELGWADSAKLEGWAQAWMAWAANPDAFLAEAKVHGVGHKP